MVGQNKVICGVSYIKFMCILSGKKRWLKVQSFTVQSPEQFEIIIVSLNNFSVTFFLHRYDNQLVEINL